MKSLLCVLDCSHRVKGDFINNSFNSLGADMHAGSIRLYQVDTLDPSLQKRVLKVREGLAPGPMAIEQWTCFITMHSTVLFPK